MVSKDYPLKGMDCVFGGDIPIGSGLSSSAALCCGFIYSITKVSGKSISREKIALIAQEAEHKIGLNCGLMDQYAVLFGKKGNAFLLDCKDLSHNYIPINLNGYSWVLVNSNIKHNLAVDSEYNKRRISCENIVKAVQKSRPEIKSLRDVTLVDLNSLVNVSSSIDIKRAKYVIEENDRVRQMIKVLTLGDALAVGEILRKGHWAMSTEYEITITELDTLVKIGEGLEGVLGSRMMGGGFGGCTINLIAKEEVKAFKLFITEAYKNVFDKDCSIYTVELSDGTHKIN